MQTQPHTFRTFAELAGHLTAERSRSAQAESRADVQRGANLRRSRALSNVRPGTGPRVAR